MDARAEWESAKRGAIDGFLESTGLDYFVGGTYGPIEGHEQAYSKGYAVGMAAGIGVTIAAGFVTGGATIGACSVNIAKIGVTAARVFNMAGMMGGVGKAADKIQDMSKNGFTVGGVASVALDLLPAASAGIGKIAKMAGKAEWLNFGGCFVAGTLVRVEAAGVRLQALDEEMVAAQRELSGVMIDQAGQMSLNERLTFATVSSDLELNHRATEFTEFGTSSTDTLLAPFAPVFGGEDHHDTLAPFAPLRGEGLGMRGDGKFEVGSGKFESSALDQALMDYEADAIEDFLFTSQASNLLPIEAVPLGSRIATKNPKPWEFDDSFKEPDASWLKIGMTVVKANGSVVDVELLRPSDWLGEFALQEGARIDLKITELEVDGFATVTSIEPCPPIAEGEGSVVIGRFATRRVDEIVTLVLRSESGREEELSGTSIHPIWSMHRNDWVPMGELDVGEVLLGHDESVTIIAKRIIQRPTPVYNIEVFGEHVYEVAALGVLVHNAALDCVKTGKAGELAAGTDKAKKGVESVLRPGTKRFPDDYDPAVKILQETKNVKYQHLSTQLRDYILIAKRDGMQVILNVRKDLPDGTHGTKLSKQLMDYIKSGDIIRNPII